MESGKMLYDGPAISNPNVELWESPSAFTVDPETVPWTETGEGAAIKLLNCDPISGRTSVLFKLNAHCRFPVHKHLCPAEFFVLQGTFGYERGPVSAGGYAFEAPFAIHEPITAGDEDMIMFAVSYGPIQVYNDDGTPGATSGLDDTLEMVRANNALSHLEPYITFPPVLEREASTASV